MGIWDYKLNFVLASIALIFIYTNVDKTIATIYGMMLGFALFLRILDEAPNMFVFSREELNLKQLAYGFGGYVLYVIVAFALIVVANIGVSLVLSNASIVSLSFSNVTPFLAGNKWASLLSFGVLIPFIETWALAMYLEYTFDKFKLNSDLREPITHAILGIFAVGVTAIHITALGLPRIVEGTMVNVGLISTLSFFYIGGLMILYFRQTIESTYTHIINNTLVMLKRLGILDVFKLLGLG